MFYMYHFTVENGVSWTPKRSEYIYNEYKNCCLVISIFNNMLAKEKSSVIMHQHASSAESENIHILTLTCVTLVNVKGHIFLAR